MIGKAFYIHFRNDTRRIRCRFAWKKRCCEDRGCNVGLWLWFWSQLERRECLLGKLFRLEQHLWVRVACPMIMGSHVPNLWSDRLVILTKYQMSWGGDKLLQVICSIDFSGLRNDSLSTKVQNSWSLLSLDLPMLISKPGLGLPETLRLCMWPAQQQ